MNSSFGKFLLEKRKEKNITQKELAKCLFVSESSISKWEKNVAHPDITLLPKLAEILEVTEHELITASVDTKTRQEKEQAKNWRRLTFSWNLFIIIGYAITVITCFICNLAIEKTLNWFWIVLTALLLSASFTNIPQYIKKYRLILVPLIEYFFLCLLLLVCNIYTKGNWFWIAIISVLLTLVIVFLPMIIYKYNFPNFFKKFNAFVSIFADFVLLLLLLLIINININGSWFFNFALPLCIVILAILYLITSVKYIKINKYLKVGIMLLMSEVMYILFLMFLNEFIKLRFPNSNPSMNNILNSNLANWSTPQLIGDNVVFIIVLLISVVSIIFLITGFIKNKNNSNK